MNESHALPDSDPERDWPSNYFNYYTEIEEHFQRARGSGLFLLSPLDWAILENWRTAGVPLDAVLKGIDETFEKWRSRKQKRQLINSIAYCTQAVMAAAERAPARDKQSAIADLPFTADQLRSYLAEAAARLSTRAGMPFNEIARSLEVLVKNAEEHLTNLEDLERRLSALEEKLIAGLRSLQSDDDLYTMRAALDRELKPYRGKMTADQLALLERRYLDTALLERAQLPRLSLFYLH